MKQLLTLIICLLAASWLWAADAMLYDLQPVTSVQGGGQYVFVQNGRAVQHTEVTSGSYHGLSTKLIDVTQPISISDDCVWTVTSILYTSYYYLSYTNSYSLGSYLRNNVGSDTYYTTGSKNLWFVSLGYTPSQWEIAFTNGNATITNRTDKTGGNSGRYLSISSSDNNICYAVPSPSQFAVYKLVPCQYTRTEIAEGQIGTVCLPFSTASYSGATFYTLLCKENDAFGNPAKVYYEQVSGQLEAGKPYVYVPDDDVTSLSFTAAAGTYTTTLDNYNGFVGTFKQIDPAPENALVGNYVISDNQFKKCGSNCGMLAYRAYVKMSEVALKDQVAAPSRRMLVIGQDAEPEYMDPTPGTATDMQNIPCAMQAQCIMQNGQVVIIRGQERYDLTGRRVE